MVCIVWVVQRNSVLFNTDEKEVVMLGDENLNFREGEFCKLGFLRIKQVLRLIPISKSNWWAGVKSGRYPQPTKLGERVTVWRAADIFGMIENAEKENV